MVDDKGDRTLPRRVIELNHRRRRDGHSDLDLNRHSSSFQTNTRIANSAPRLAHQVTPFHRCTVAPDATLNGCTFVFD
jgi:hypothetical protein